MVEMNGKDPVRDENGKLVPLVHYPFAEDGLDIWMAMKEWFGAYLAIYYPDDATVRLNLQKKCYNGSRRMKMSSEEALASEQKALWASSSSLQ